MRSPMVMVAVLIIGLAATIHAASDEVVRIVTTPAGERSLTPHLATSHGGGGGEALYLSWLERTEEGHRLRVAHWNGDGAFVEPSTVRASSGFFANWADFPSVLVLNDGRLVAHWLEKSAEGTYDYDIWMAFSNDGGKTWGEPEKPYRDTSLGEHGFVSMVARGESGFAAVWLDPRNEGGMSLFGTTHDGKSFGEAVELDGRVCDCCQTGMAETSEGLFVAYRDRSEEEMRDMSYVRFVDATGTWTEPRNLNADGWQINACPVNGPQVAARGNRLAVAWFSAAQDEPRVEVKFSSDAGASLSKAIRVDGVTPVGRVDVALASGGDEALVFWIEHVDGGTGEVRFQRVKPSGTGGEPIAIAKTAAGRASGFPRVAVLGNELFVSWTESYERGGASRVHAARMNLDLQ